MNKRLINKTEHHVRCFSRAALLLLLLVSAFQLQAQDSTAASDQPIAEAERLELERQREAMLVAIEKSRLEVERAAAEASMRAEELRVETERLREKAENMEAESQQAQEAMRSELARHREELSRTHRELRRASKEVARAHRELILAEDRRIRARAINLGDRAILGVILGDETTEGLKIMGVSPDGPAERAGIESGDILVSLRGESLASDAPGPPRDTVYQIMSDVGDGEEISATVLREGNAVQVMVRPEKREPASWASYIRLPEPVLAPAAPGAPAAPVAPHIAIERIAVPPVNTAVIAAEAAALAEEFEEFHVLIEDGDGEALNYSYEINIDPSDFEFDTEAFSEIGSMALEEARVWFDGGATFGIRFASLNEGLGDYFDTNTGLLVLEAPQDNAFGLLAGDVVLRVGKSDINATSDFIRALRNYESGESVVVEIKRNKRNVSLDAVIPENRFGFFFGDMTSDSVHAQISEGHIED